MTLIRNWGFRMILLYGGFVALMLTLALIAMRNSNDLVSANYYDQEIAYESQIQRIRATKLLKEPLTWVVHGRRIEFYFPESRTAPTGSITLYRASDAGQDRVIPIGLDETARQTIEFTTMAKGTWRMKVLWEADGGQYYNEDEIYLE